MDETDVNVGFFLPYIYDPNLRLGYSILYYSF